MLPCTVSKIQDGFDFIGGSRGRAQRRPPKGPDSLVSTYNIFEMYASGVNAPLRGRRPLREILDPSLDLYVLNETILVFQMKF